MRRSLRFPSARAMALAVLGLVALGAGLAAMAPAPAVAPPPAEAPAAEFGLDQWPMSPAAARGRVVYQKNCIGCHGPEGRGDGPASRWLDPLPRDFQQARFKFRSTPSGELPLPTDLLHTVTCGLHGSAMPSFPLLPEQERKDVVEWVLHLARFGLVKGEIEYVMEDEEIGLQEVLDERLDEIVDEVLADASEEVWPVAVPPEPEADEDSIARGKELYQAQCVACHGVSGRGDGPSAFSLRDWKDAVVRPRDFTTGVFRAGSQPADLFLRLKTGLNGTPMPAVYQPDEDIWAMVHYILSLQDDSTRVPPHPTSCEARLQETGEARP